MYIPERRLQSTVTPEPTAANAAAAMQLGNRLTADFRSAG